MISKQRLISAILLAACGLATLQVARGEERKAPVDLRETGCIHQIEDEGKCDGAYAYSAMALSAYHICMAKQPEAGGKRSVDRYHARFVSDCGSAYTFSMMSCNGGFVSMALDFISQTGLPTFNDYKAAQMKRLKFDKCPFEGPRDYFKTELWPIKLQGAEILHEARNQKLKFDDVHEHLTTVGPVVVNLYERRSVLDYKGGVLGVQSEDPSGGTRAMLIVGFAYDSNQVPYYTLWTSKGTKWGESGYLRISEEYLEELANSFYAFRADSIKRS